MFLEFSMFMFVMISIYCLVKLSASWLFVDVTLFKIFMVIVKTIMTLVVIIISIVSWVSTVVFFILFWLFTILLIIGGTLFLPAVAGIIVYYAVSNSWDQGFRPIFSLIQSGINFVIGLWNSAARALRSFGVRLPTANGIGASAPTFWEFMKWVIYTLVWGPIEAGLKGKIIR